MKRKLCPALGQKCRKCGKDGHFAVECRVKSQGAKVHAVKEDVFYIHSICGQDQAFVSLALNNSVSVSFQIYTVSTANSLPLQEYI